MANHYFLVSRVNRTTLDIGINWGRVTPHLFRTRSSDFAALVPLNPSIGRLVAEWGRRRLVEDVQVWCESASPESDPWEEDADWIMDTAVFASDGRATRIDYAVDLFRADEGGQGEDAHLEGQAAALFEYVNTNPSTGPAEWQVGGGGGIDGPLSSDNESVKESIGETAWLPFSAESCPRPGERVVFATEALMLSSAENAIRFSLGRVNYEMDLFGVQRPKSITLDDVSTLLAASEVRAWYRLPAWDSPLLRHPKVPSAADRSFVGDPPDPRVIDVFSLSDLEV